MNDFIGFMHEMVAFVLVAESGSFSKAALQLAMTPSAVSRQISRLEKAMGVKLMHRTTRQLRLTEAGVDVLERGREMVDAARATMQAAEEHMRAPKGLVRVSAPKAFARHVLQNALLSFLARYPDVDVHVMVVDRPVDGLRENVDLVIRLTDDPPQGMVARRLMPVAQWMVASAAYLSAHDAIERPEDLVDHSCLSLGEQDRDNRWRFTRHDETREVLVRGRFTINHSEMRLDAVFAGFGVGCVPDFVARDAIAQGRVVRVLPDWTFQAGYQGTACLLYAAARYTTPKVRVLIEHLMDALSTSR